jgi:hypothetical protein
MCGRARHIFKRGRPDLSNDAIIINRLMDIFTMTTMNLYSMKS